MISRIHEDLEGFMKGSSPKATSDSLGIFQKFLMYWQKTEIWIPEVDWLITVWLLVIFIAFIIIRFWVI